MAEVRYKEISSALAKMSKPEEFMGRISIGLEKNIGEFYYLNTDDLLPFKNQARKFFAQEDIEALANSIKLHGIRHPLTVIPHPGEKGKFEVVSGERRLRAAKFLNMQKVPCILLKDINLADEIAIIENVHRQDLHPVELGMAMQTMLTSGIFRSQQELANKLSLTKSKVSEHINYANLDEKIKDYLIKNEIVSRDMLRKLVKAEGNPDAIQKILSKTRSKSMDNFSVMRVTLSSGKIKIQLGGIAKLTPEKRIELKKELERIADKLL